MFLNFGMEILVSFLLRSCAADPGTMGQNSSDPADIQRTKAAVNQRSANRNPFIGCHSLPKHIQCIKFQGLNQKKSTKHDMDMKKVLGMRLKTQGIWCKDINGMGKQGTWMGGNLQCNFKLF